MPTKKIPAAPDIYQIKVTLFDTEPPVWRRMVLAIMILKSFHLTTSITRSRVFNAAATLPRVSPAAA
jgi:hypothetical protein